MRILKYIQAALQQFGSLTTLTKKNEVTSKQIWECLNVGTVPTYKRHDIGTVPMFKMHNIGTVPTSKMHNVGTVPTFKMYNIGLSLRLKCTM